MSSSSQQWGAGVPALGLPSRGLSVDLNFKSSQGPSASSLCDCVCAMLVCLPMHAWVCGMCPSDRVL